MEGEEWLERREEWREAKGMVRRGEVKWVTGRVEGKGRKGKRFEA
jgi:hypothetical protein